MRFFASDSLRVFITDGTLRCRVEEINEKPHVKTTAAETGNPGAIDKEPGVQVKIEDMLGNPEGEK